MAFEEGSTKPEGSGRKKGTPNKNSFNARKLVEELQCDPLELLIWIMNNDWKKLGFSSAYKTSTSDSLQKDKNGKAKKKVTKTPHITLKMRMEVAIELIQYLYPKLKASEIDPDGEDSGSKTITLAYNLDRE